MKAESVGRERDFGIGSILISVRSLSSIDQSCLIGLWLNTGKKSLWRTKEAEHRLNTISETIRYCLMAILL